LTAPEVTTRIDFHSNVGSQLDYACRLTRKALGAGCKLVVLHQDAQQLAEFDQQLWSFSGPDFLPHVAAHDRLARHTPVVLCLAGETQTIPGNREILLNLSDAIPDGFDQFERLIEIVGQDGQSKEAGRQRYRHYQQQGYQLTHIPVK